MVRFVCCVCFFQLVSGEASSEPVSQRARVGEILKFCRHDRTAQHLVVGEDKIQLMGTIHQVSLLVRVVCFWNVFAR